MSVASASSTSSVLERLDGVLADLKGIRKDVVALMKGSRRKRIAAEGSDEPKTASAWVAWTSLVTTKYKDAYEKYIAALPVNAKGVQPKSDPMGFASKCRKELFVDDWNEHERIWKSDHVTVAAAAEPSDAAEPTAVPTASVAEAKPKPKPRGKAKATKEEPSAEAAAEAIEWKNRGKVYMKNPANQVWQVADDGVGEYVGFFDGKAILKGKLAAE